MPLRDRLRHLDAKALKFLRQPDESAEHFLRRAAAREWPHARFLPSEVQAALREYFAEQPASKV